jgi:hypothetical protein
MKVIDFDKNQINNINDWEEKFFKGTQKEKHWKEGRSSYALAKFVMNYNGADKITDIVSKIIGRKVVLEKAIPEWEIRFDEFGHGREHDLGIWGKVEGTNETLFIGIEAKVDESFGSSVSDAYVVAKTKQLNAKTTNAPQRIEKLLQRNFKTVEHGHWNLRYQLLYATVGTVSENTDISVLLVIVFKTDKYDELIGNNNYKDYVKFLKAIKAEKISDDKDIEAHKISVDDKILYSIYVTI